MPVIAKKTGGNFIPCPAGSHVAVCVDVVDLGIIETTWGGKTRSQHKIYIVWQVAERMADNRPYIVRRRYTCSLNERASLRKDLESWRGRAFSDIEQQGFDLEKLIGIGCMLSVMRETREGEIYANVNAVMRLPRGVVAPKPDGYTRVKDRQQADGTSTPAVSTGEQYTPVDEEAPPPEYDATDDDIPF